MLGARQQCKRVRVRGINNTDEIFRWLKFLTNEFNHQIDRFFLNRINFMKLNTKTLTKRRTDDKLHRKLPRIVLMKTKSKTD